MSSLIRSIVTRGGLVATHELYHDGYSRAYLASAVRSGHIIRVRQGWYAHPRTPDALIRAARVGGQLTCLSGVALHGIWQYPSALLHVAVPAEACRLRHPRDKTVRLTAGQTRVKVHWRKPDATTNRLLLDPPSCLADVIRCQPAEVAVLTADSAIVNRLINLDQWARIVEDAPSARRPGLDRAHGVCESGTESLVSFRLHPFHLPLRCQARIGGFRVDFLIGTKLIVEVDGAEYHTDPERFESDRRRDAVLSRLGYRVLRFSYKQVLYRWLEVEAAILAAVVRGDHH